MKRIFFPLLGMILCVLALPTLLTGCKDPGKSSVQTSGSGEDATRRAQAHETATLDPADRVYDPALYVVIRTAEDLVAFNRAVNLDGYRFDGMTVVFTDDVDMSGYIWTPLDGTGLVGVTFDGLGHTVSGLRFADHEYPLDAEPPADEKGCGLVATAVGNMAFRDLTLADSRVAAYDHSVGNFVGSVQGGLVSFKNCRSEDFTADGWMDWFYRDRSAGGHAIAMRLGGFVGYIGEGGSARFEGCTVERLTLSGFHNLAGFVGYDGSGTLDASCFSDCAVADARLTFSYCLAEGYTVDQPKKFVSVFFNSSDWADNLDACTARGNTFAEVIYYDWADDSTAYAPENFRSSVPKETEPYD